MCSTIINQRKAAGLPVVAVVTALVMALGGFGAQAAPIQKGSSADLAVTISDSPDPVLAGNLLTYTLSFINNGFDAAVNVEVSMAVPAGTVFVNTVPDTGWDDSTSGVSSAVFTKASVSSGETATLTAIVRVLNDVSQGSIISATATATSDTADGFPTNNSSSTTTVVDTAADLLVILNDSPDPVDPGTNITYEYSLANAGPSVAQNVAVTLPVPPNTTFVSGQVLTGSGWSASTPAVGSIGFVVFSKGTVLRLEGTVFQVVVNVDASATGDISATATATSTTTDPDPSNNSATATTTTTGTEPCSLKVRRPNGGEVWTIGTKQRIKWAVTGSCSQYVRIELFQNGSKVKNIKKSTLNDGKVGWKIKATKFVPGTDYKVRIRCLDGSGVKDFSNGPFTLVAP